MKSINFLFYFIILNLFNFFIQCIDPSKDPNRIIFIVRTDKSNKPNFYKENEIYDKRIVQFEDELKGSESSINTTKKLLVASLINNQLIVYLQDKTLQEPSIKNTAILSAENILNLESQFNPNVITELKNFINKNINNTTLNNFGFLEKTYAKMILTRYIFNINKFMQVNYYLQSNFYYGLYILSHNNLIQGKEYLDKAKDYIAITKVTTTSKLAEITTLDRLINLEELKIKAQEMNSQDLKKQLPTFISSLNSLNTKLKI